jgi:creatinine amidohydrolase
MELCNLTWKEAREWVQRNPVVIVPTGSTEQHGPHLPLKVDIATADFIAKKVSEKTNHLVTPPLNFGYSEMWHRFPGIISFTQDTFKAALRDICLSLIRGGFKKIFILNGHNGNMMLLQSVMWELIDRYEDQGIQLGCGTVWFFAKEACDRVGLNFKDGTHACEMETSVALSLFPECVKLREAEKVSSQYKMRKIIYFDPEVTVVNKWPDPQSYHGVYGDPAAATAEKGKSYLEALIDRVAQVVSDFDKGLHNPVRSDGTPRDF